MHSKIQNVPIPSIPSIIDHPSPHTHTRSVQKTWEAQYSASTNLSHSSWRARFTNVAFTLYACDYCFLFTSACSTISHAFVTHESHGHGNHTVCSYKSRVHVSAWLNVLSSYVLRYYHSQFPMGPRMDSATLLKTRCSPEA